MTMSQHAPTAAPHGPFANASALFPRLHPALSAAQWCALCAVLGFGPLAGIPAIVFGSTIAREIQAAPRLYRGLGRARATVVAASAGTYGYGGMIAFLLTEGAPALSYLFFVAAALVGVVLVVRLVMTKTTASSSASVAAGFRSSALNQHLAACAIAMVGSAFGGLDAAHRVAEARALEAAQRCSSARAGAERAVARRAFADARNHLVAAKESCAPAEGSELSRLATLTDIEETKEKRRLEQELERARQQRERELLERFPAETPSLRTRLRETSALVGQRRWQTASDELDGVEANLRAFEDTPIEDDVTWQALTTQVRQLRRVIAPALAEARRLAELRQEAEERRERARQEAAERTRLAAEKRREAAEAAAAREASRSVLCCDGTLSPTCLCSRASKRGCCSHHGGICGCE